MLKFKSFDSPEFLQTKAEFDARSSLGVTADDHLGVGSTPSEELKNNPGKTLGELMTKEEASAWIKELEGQITEFSQEKYKGSSLMDNVLPDIIKDLNLSKEYLTSIGKLPAEKE